MNIDDFRKAFPLHSLMRVKRSGRLFRVDGHRTWGYFSEPQVRESPGEWWSLDQVEAVDLPGPAPLSDAVRADIARYDRLVDERDRELGKLGDPDVDEITYHPRYDEIVSNFDHDFAELLHDLIHDIRHIGEPT